MTDYLSILTDTYSSDKNSRFLYKSLALWPNEALDSQYPHWIHVSLMHLLMYSDESKEATLYIAALQYY